LQTRRQRPGLVRGQFANGGFNLGHGAHNKMVCWLGCFVKPAT
jgi:hypothetical protein